MKKLLITALLISPLAHSQLKNTPRSFWGSISEKMGISSSLEIEIKENNYILKGPAADKQRMIQALSRYSSVIPQGQVDFNRPIIIDDIVPSTIKNNKWERHLLNGPNCHNNTLITIGLMDRRMQVNPEEFYEHLKYYCEEVSQPEQGAIGVQFGSDTFPIHSYTILSGDMTYEKADVDGAKAPYFRRFSDSRKQNDTFYRCKNRDLKRSCSPHVQELANKIDRLHKETSEMIYNLKGAFKLSEKRQRAYELEAEVFRDGSCSEYQEILLKRIGSILATYTEMEMTGAIYGKTTYDRSPKI